MATKSEVKTVGGYIRELRMAKDMTLQELAEAVSINLKVLSRIELGERSLNMDYVPGLAKALGVDYKTLQVDLIALKIEEDYGKEKFAEEAFKKLNRGDK